jgi:hypothetical protein
MKASMRHGSSNFYSNFSMTELVKRNSSWPPLESSLGGGVGGGGGGCFSRVGSHGPGSGLSRFHKTDSFAFQLNPGGLAKIDEGKFLSSLNADLQDEIVKSGARVTTSGDLETPGRFVEYSEEGVQGRIEISGRSSGRDGRAFYTLTASLSETSTRENPDWMRQIKRHQAKGIFYVVPIWTGDQPTATEDLLALGKALIRRSSERVRQLLLADQSRKDTLLPNLEYAEVYVWKPIPSEIRKRLKNVIAREFRVPTEYEQFEKVYFLNEVALTMYREAGADFLIFKKISADELSSLPGPALRGPYLPKNS